MSQEHDEIVWCRCCQSRIERPNDIVSFRVELRIFGYKPLNILEVWCIKCLILHKAVIPD